MVDRTVIDLFCGAGGLSEGFSQAGFRILAGNDFFDAAGATFASTHRNARFLPGPIDQYSADDFLDVAGLRPGELDVLVGGPPCQGLSLAGKRLSDDPRNNLFRSFVAAIKLLRPNIYCKGKS